MISNKAIDVKGNTKNNAGIVRSIIQSVSNFVNKFLIKLNDSRGVCNLNKIKMLEYALESSLEASIIIGEDKRVLYSNDTFNRILNYPKNIKKMTSNEVINKLLKNVKNPQKLKEQFLKSIELGENHLDNIYLKNGEVLKPRFVEFKEKDKDQGIIISFSNISESHKLKELDDLKDKALGNIVHDLRTPITIIMSTIELYKMEEGKISGLDKGKFCDHSYNSVEENCLRLLKLVNNLIDTTKLSKDHIQFSLENYNIVSLVEDITGSVSNYAHRKGISLIFDTNTEEKIMGCNGESIERIILNLLSNAIKFTPRGGLIKVNLEDKDDKIYISIKDNGIGIPKEMQKDIFDPFKQINNLNKREMEGSGMGLSIVRLLVEKQGGYIYINDKYEKGAEFIIELPVNLVDEDGKAKDLQSHYQVNERILNIELSDI